MAGGVLQKMKDIALRVVVLLATLVALKILPHLVEPVEAMTVYAGKVIFLVAVLVAHPTVEVRMVYAGKVIFLVVVLVVCLPVEAKTVYT